MFSLRFNGSAAVTGYYRPNIKSDGCTLKFTQAADVSQFSVTMTPSEKVQSVEWFTQTSFLKLVDCDK